MTNTAPLTTYWIDAFTDRPFQGNPAVVVPQADGLSDQQMQQIAREVNCSETAFVLTASQPEADFRLRWFTPTQEVDLCGHATVATLHALAQEGRFNLSRGVTQYLYIESRSGLLPITVDWTEAQPWIWLSLPKCSLDALPPMLASELAALLQIPQPDLIAFLDSLNHDVLIEIPQLKQLHALSPDFAALAKLGKQQGWRGVCVYTTETVEPSSSAHSRFFAPQSGIQEDPVTGSVSGPLAQLLQKTSASLAQTWRFEQGDCMGRAGRLVVELKGETPKVRGQAVTVMRGELYL